jgi:anaerobic selenocysteine-containing dehydrogenase
MSASAPPAPTPAPAAWRQTACILCSINCGLEVQLDGRRLARIRGDKAHPASQGYTCEKPTRLDHYQNGRHRLTSPLRRRADGSFEPVDWDTAIREVAAGFARVRDAHGGASILYYGGGGQGNHLPGAYARATRAALGSVYASNALAQEKTGEFWVDGQLFGRPSCHTAPDFEHAEVAVFVGKNPWQSHGFPRARAVLREIAKDPGRTLVVIDPRRTETAELADFHLQVRPGADAFLLAALLAVLAEEKLLDAGFVAAHTTGADDVLAALAEVSIPDACGRAGVPEADVRAVARRIAGAASVSILEDLGIQQAPHSTLNSYLEKLVALLTGNFAKRGASNLHTHFGALIGRGTSDRRSPVGGHRIIAGMIPCNAIPEEILTDHPKRFRALLVESANPAHSLADSPRMREALEALEFVAVIDVALTETAKLADYVLPAASQFEKWEATFFTLEFPHNVFHLRAPLLDPLPGTLPEPEIHARLVRALGALGDEDLAPLHAAAAQGRGAFAGAFFQALGKNPKLGASRRWCSTRRWAGAFPTAPRSGGRRLGARAPGRAGVPGVGPPRRLRRRLADRAGRAPLRRDPGEPQRGRLQRRPAGSELGADRARRRAHPPRHPGPARRAARPARRGPRRPRPGLPLRAGRRRAPHQHRQHDLPRSRVAAEGRPGRPAHEPGGRRPPRDRRRRPRPRHHPARQRRGGGGAHGHAPARPRDAAQRTRPRLPGRGRPRGRARRRAQRADLLRGPRLAGGHAVAQARARPRRGGRAVIGSGPSAP